MNIVLGSAFLLLTGIFYILVSGEKGNRKQKGARWIQRWGRKHGWQLPEWMTEECIWQTLEILLLSTWGYSGREVAKIMGMAEQTIYTKRNRLRKKLKNLSKIE